MSIKKIYISGPMTGYPGLNFELFSLVSENLRLKGNIVVNPAEIQKNEDYEWVDYMSADLIAMKGCNTICMLPGWENSFGARIEHLAAQKMKMDVFELDELLSLDHK